MSRNIGDSANPDWQADKGLVLSVAVLRVCELRAKLSRPGENMQANVHLSRLATLHRRTEAVHPIPTSC